MLSKLIRRCLIGVFKDKKNNNKIILLTLINRILVKKHPLVKLSKTPLHTHATFFLSY